MGLPFAAAAPLLAAGPAGIAAAGLGAVASIVSGMGENDAAKARARALEAAAHQSLQEAGMKVQQGLEQDNRTEAGAAVSAASGGGFGGSAMDVLGDLQRQSLRKVRATVYQGQTEANRDLYDAQVSRMEGKNALISSAVKAGSSLLGEYGQAAEFKRMSGGR